MSLFQWDKRVYKLLLLLWYQFWFLSIQYEHDPNQASSLLLILLIIVGQHHNSCWSIFRAQLTLYQSPIGAVRFCVSYYHSILFIWYRTSWYHVYRYHRQSMKTAYICYQTQSSIGFHTIFGSQIIVWSWITYSSQIFIGFH
jgi:hypothetical protein